MATSEPKASGNKAPILGEMLSRIELAAELRITPRSLARWAWLRKGPPKFRIGGRTYYRRADVELWLEEQKVADKRSPGVAS